MYMYVAVREWDRLDATSNPTHLDAPSRRRKKTKAQRQMELDQIRQARKDGIPFWEVAKKFSLSPEQLQEYIDEIKRQDKKLFDQTMADKDLIGGEALLLKDRLNEIIRESSSIASDKQQPGKVRLEALKIKGLTSVAVFKLGKEAPLTKGPLYLLPRSIYPKDPETLQRFKKHLEEKGIDTTGLPETPDN